MIIDRKLLSAIAFTTLLGTIPSKNSTSDGTGATASAPASAPRSAAADSAGSGTNCRNSGVRNAAAIAEHAMIVTYSPTARPARRPACAASAVAATPVTSSANTSGTTVICSAFSHAVPIGCATAVVLATEPGAKAAARMPATRPRTSPARMRVAEDISTIPSSAPRGVGAPHSLTRGE